MRPLLIVATGLLFTAACTSSPADDAASDTTSTTVTTPATTTTAVAVQTGTHFDAESIGVGFSLADSFEQSVDPDLIFLAISTSPRAVFSIGEDFPKVINHPARPGETLTDLDLGGLRAVIVTDAAIEGLPAGISANELLVSNGDWSFSAIMSAPTGDLADLWVVFLNSVVVQPFE